jgi:c-di-GMP-binding flagellar brake protein YcgR
MALSEFDLEIFKSACEVNQNITILAQQKEDPVVYRSRLLHIDLAQKAVIIDEPSPESPGAMPLSKGETIEVFFEIKTFRYIFTSRITDHTMFHFQNKGFYALKIQVPSALRDGERREYFRVEIARTAPVPVFFHIYKQGGEQAVMSSIIEGNIEEFRGDLLDISGGGFAMRGDPHTDLEKGDNIGVRFRLRPDFPEFELWCEVRNKHRLAGTDAPVWGVIFLKEELNPFIRSIRNKILRFVLERQRELLFK